MSTTLKMRLENIESQIGSLRTQIETLIIMRDEILFKMNLEGRLITDDDIDEFEQIIMDARIRVGLSGTSGASGVSGAR